MGSILWLEYNLPSSFRWTWRLLSALGFYKKHYSKPSCTRLFVYMDENLSRAVAFKLFWPWLILRNDVLHHDPHLCVYKTEREKKSFTKQIPDDLRHILIFSILCPCFTNSNHYPLNWFYDSLKMGFKLWKTSPYKDKHLGVELPRCAAQTSDVVNFSRSLTFK